MTQVENQERIVRYKEWMIPTNGLGGAPYNEVELAISMAREELVTRGIRADTDDCIRVFAGDDEIIVRIELQSRRELDEIEITWLNGISTDNSSGKHLKGTRIKVPRGTEWIVVTP